MSEENNPVFDAAYWAAQDPLVRALDAMDQGDARIAAAVALAIKGHKIDVPIMAWGWDPWKVMKQRAGFGFTWVPSALGAPVTVAPGLGVPGMSAYDPGNPPPGAIKVSTNAVDYPPFDPPPPPPSPPPADFVGPQSIGNIYQVIPGDHTPEGKEVSDSRGTFIKHLVPAPFGFWAWYEKKP